MSRKLIMGLPQGCPISPVLYSVRTRKRGSLNSNDLIRLFPLADNILNTSENPHGSHHRPRTVGKYAENAPRDRL